MFFDPPKRRGVWDALNEVFTGQRNAAITAEQERAASRRAWILGGLSTIASNAEGGSGIGALARGALAGNEVGEQGRAQYAGENAAQAQHARMAQLASGGRSLESLHAMFQHAASTGDYKLATALQEVIKAVEAADTHKGGTLVPAGGALVENGKEVYRNPGAPAAQRTVTGEGPEGYGVYNVNPDGTAGKLVIRQPKPGSGVAARPRQIRMVGSQGDGIYQVDEDGNEIKMIGGAPGSTNGTEGERKAAAFLAFLPTSIGIVDAFEGTPSRLQDFANGRGIREITSEEQQTLDAAAIPIGEAWLRMTTGAAYNPTEFKNAGYMFIPKPGDKPATVALKRVYRQKLMEMMRTQAGKLAHTYNIGAPEKPGRTPRPEEVFGAGGGAGGGATAGSSAIDALGREATAIKNKLFGGVPQSLFQLGR